jgi:hypothetical protein
LRGFESEKNRGNSTFLEDKICLQSGEDFSSEAGRTTEENSFPFSASVGKSKFFVTPWMALASGATTRYRERKLEEERRMHLRLKFIVFKTTDVAGGPRKAREREGEAYGVVLHFHLFLVFTTPRVRQF